METESSSKDPGAEGGLATWVLTLHLLLVSLTSGSPSDRRGAVGEQLRLRPLSWPLSWSWGRMYFSFQTVAGEILSFYI